jgi:hypothetical protein
MAGAIEIQLLAVTNVNKTPYLTPQCPTGRVADGRPGPDSRIHNPDQSADRVLVIGWVKREKDPRASRRHQRH